MLDWLSWQSYFSNVLKTPTLITGRCSSCILAFHFPDLLQWFLGLRTENEFAKNAYLDWGNKLYFFPYLSTSEHFIDVWPVSWLKPFPTTLFLILFINSLKRLIYILFAVQSFTNCIGSSYQVCTMEMDINCNLRKENGEH